MKQAPWIFLLLVIVSCKKEKMIDAAPSMIGTWVHYEAETAWEILIINEDGSGKIIWYTNSKVYRETNVKDWYVKDNALYLGKVTFGVKPYKIDEFPLPSSTTTIEGYDTLVQGQRYCILDDLYFVEKL